MSATDSSQQPRTEMGSPLQQQIRERLLADGWWPFDKFMATALYAPEFGYYSGGRQKFGLLPDSGSDFVTAPELSPLFGQALATQVAQALSQTGTDEVWEFGAGTGALAEQLLSTLGDAVRRYVIVDLSGTLRARQAERLKPWAHKLVWLDALPDRFSGVVVGNEVLDAMPVQLIRYDGRHWLERGVVREGDGLGWADRPTRLQPPWTPADGFAPGFVTELHAQAEAFVRTLAAQLERGAAFFIDYGFPESEYYHAQRSGGTLMCHYLHQADPDPLQRVGDKDITAHVNFTGIALAGQDAGLQVLGYTSQANFLINCGLIELMAQASLPARTMAHKLLAEHEMGELFKVIGFVVGPEFDAIGFQRGDRSHML